MDFGIEKWIVYEAASLGFCCTVVFTKSTIWIYEVLTLVIVVPRGKILIEQLTCVGRAYYH
jgi:hypothetical protein